MTKLAVILLMLTVLAPLQAQVPTGFDQTVAAYEQGRVEAARTAFQRMAEAGLTEAQFNYGVMLLNGEGGSSDAVNGSAWIQVAAQEHYAPAEEVMQILRSQFDEQRLHDVTVAAEVLAAQFGRKSLLERHRPVLRSPSGGKTKSTSARSTRRVTVNNRGVRFHIPTPNYPLEAGDGTMGVVQLGGWVGADGTVQHPHVISSHPGRIFDRVALRAFSNLRAEWLEEPPARPAYHTQQITFTLESFEGPTALELMRVAKAGEQELEAQFRAIWMIEQLGIPDIDIAPDSRLEVTHAAAIAGIEAAQLHLGRQLRNGSQVERDLASGTFWLMQAAFEGNAEAAFELSHSTEIDEQFRRDLRRSAINSGLEAALLWEIRYQVENPQYADPDDLQELIEQLPRRLRRASNDPVLNDARRLAGM
ncbi:MAG: energy transducer TonB [Wenzhouxiangella sp.]